MKTRPIPDALGNHYGHAIRCRACREAGSSPWHVFVTSGRAGWNFDGDLETPTFSPSMLVQAELGEERRKYVCHSFVRGGKIEYLSDCTHKYAGQTLDLEEYE